MERNSKSRLLFAEILIAILVFALSSTVVLRLFYLSAESSKHSTAMTKAVCEAQNWAERLYARVDAQAFLKSNGFLEDENGYSLKLADGMILRIVSATIKTDYGMISSYDISVLANHTALIEITQKKYWPEEKR